MNKKVSPDPTPNSVSHQIQIDFTNVPPELNGVPLPIDILNLSGKRESFSQILQENSSITHSVVGTGHYLVRAQLPTGLSVSQSVTIPTESTETILVKLDFGHLAPSDGNPIRDFSASTFTTSRPLEPIFYALPPTRFGAQEHIIALQSLPTEKSIPIWPLDLLNLTYFGSWIEKPKAGDGVQGAVIRLEKISSKNLDLSLGHPGLSRWHPVMVILEILNFRITSHSIVAWPPITAPLSIRVASDWQDNGLSSPLLASIYIDEPVVRTLFLFVQGQSLESARLLIPHLEAVAGNFLREKNQNPIYATIAAYSLLKVRSSEKLNWVKNLADRFEFLPDGAIIYAWYLLFDNNADEAQKYFQIALDRGIPMFSEGLRLLRDGVHFLHGLKPEDETIRSQREFISRITAMANLDSELTCLRVGENLDVELLEKASN